MDDTPSDYTPSDRAEFERNLETIDQSRRRIMQGAALSVAAGSVSLLAATEADAQSPARPEYADPAESALPNLPFDIDLSNTALLVVDPQIDFLSPDGVTWPVVGKSVTEQNTVENIEELFKAAKDVGMEVFISPHYYFPHDHRWRFEGALEKVMHNLGMFDRPGPLDMQGFEGSGADWMPQYKKYINDGKTVVCSPHKVYGPENNDLVLQLRKRGMDKVILAGMSANLCVQAHLHELLETGFDVAVVRDATAAAQIPDGDGYLAALINYRFLSSGVWWTSEAVEKIRTAAA